MPNGIYHITNSGECSWYEFACEIFQQSGIKMEVREKCEDVGSGIKPLYTAMQSKKVSPLRHWKEAGRVL